VNKLRLTFSRSVCLGVEPIWGSRPDINYYLTVTVLSISGAPSDERSGLSFVLVTVLKQYSSVNLLLALASILYISPYL
jgi:hypothetical protein